MKFSKKINTFIALLLLATTFVSHKTHAMEPEQPKKWWVSYAADVIIYGTDALRDLLSFISLEPIYPPESKFASLPKEIQQTIIALLSERTNAKTLAKAAHAINSLAHVNKQLNELINDPQFCLQIIKYLAQQFDCSDETAAAALQTKEANHRLAIQKQFENLFTGQKFNEKTFSKFYNNHLKYVDLNFTYNDFSNPKKDTEDTLLMCAIKCSSPDKKYKLSSLLKTNLININYQNKTGLTALMQGASFCNTPKEFAVLIAYPNINVNLQDRHKNTALHYACARNRDDSFEYIKILLNAGADPEIAGIKGKTPLTILERNGRKEDIDLIKEAIEKKHEQK